jgi:hypothetical protein
MMTLDQVRVVCSGRQSGLGGVVAACRPPPAEPLRHRWSGHSQALFKRHRPFRQYLAGTDLNMVRGAVSAKPKTGGRVTKPAKNAKSGRPTGRRTSSGAGASGVAGRPDGEGQEMVYSEPVLVEPSKYDQFLGADTYLAVDYENARYAVGDHVALYAGPGKEWVCIIEHLYMSPEDGKPCFKGRWYWSLGEVEEHRRGRGEKARSSKNAKHELISSDNRDSNPVEVINRKCVILSWKNFRDLYKRNRQACEGVYYCDRLYYHKASKFQELTHITFPGDAIPPSIRPPPVADRDSIAEQEGDAPLLRAPMDDELDVADAHRNPAIVPATFRRDTSGGARSAEPRTIGNDVST